MSVLVYLVPIALFLSLLGLVGFVWSLKRNQFDDLDGAGMRILVDDDIAEESRAGNDPKG